MTELRFGENPFEYKLNLARLKYDVFILDDRSVSSQANESQTDQLV